MNGSDAPQDEIPAPSQEPLSGEPKQDKGSRHLHHEIAALRTSEERYEEFFENVRGYGIFVCNAEGTITGWTEGAHRVYGYTAEEAVGQPLSVLYTPEDIQSLELQRELQEAARTGRAERQVWLVRKNGERFWANEIATAIRNAEGQLLGFSKISRDLTEQKRIQDALAESEERYRLAVGNISDYAIFTLDLDNTITSWNIGATKILGFSPEEAVGRTGDIIFTEEDKARGEVQKELQKAAQENRAIDERWHIRKDETRFWASGVMHAIHDEPGQLRGFVKVLRDETERRQQEEAIRRTKEELELRVAERTQELRNTTDELQAQIAERLRLLDELVRVQEQERERISRELHDHLGQHLTALMFGLANAHEQASGAPALQRRLADLKEQANRLTGEMRNLAMELRPPVLEQLGLRAALDDYLEDWAERTGVPVDLHWSLPETIRLSTAVENTIYRIVQEALTNVARHARATQVSVVSMAQKGAVQLIIEDNGQGFDVEATTQPGAHRHLGLVGMRERAALLGGNVSFESRQGSGTSVFCRLPMETIIEG